MSRSDEQIEALAEQFRMRVGINSCIFVDALTLLPKMKKFYGVGHLTTAELGPNAEGRYDDIKKIMLFPESALIGSYWGDGRARMTIAHEVAHAALGHKGILNRSTTGSRAEMLSRLVKRQETEAKRFAAAILAPLRLMDAAMTREQISMRFGLSLNAASIRSEQFSERERRKNGAKRELPEYFVSFMRTLETDDFAESGAPHAFVEQECQGCMQRKLISVGTKLLCTSCGAVAEPRASHP
jgi:IrrE N-terminal-like domain